MMTSKKSDYTVPPKSKTGQGLNFVINQEKYLRIFLEDGDVPIDNSASERAIRTFVWARETGCFTIPQKEQLPVQWYIVFLKPQS